MSSADLKGEIEKWNAEERFFAEAYLRHLRRKDSLKNRQELESGWAEFEEGKSFSLEQVEKLHEVYCS